MHQLIYFDSKKKIIITSWTEKQKADCIRVAGLGLRIDFRARLPLAPRSRPQLPRPATATL
ncbi:MAG: hypothetical protein ACTSQI_18175 [Candidatus Helarchaeota archaeon]